MNVFLFIMKKLIFVWRMKQENKEIWFTAIPGLVHLEGQTAEKIGSMKTILLWDSCYRYYDKHHLNMMLLGISLRLEYYIKSFLRLFSSNENAIKYRNFCDGARWAIEEHSKGKGFKAPHRFN